MKKVLLILICVANFGVAETTSLDISISDMKEAIYRLIRDVREIKAMEGSTARKEIQTLKRKVADLERLHQKMMVSQKVTRSANKKRGMSDSLIDAFVSKNSKTSTK